MGCGYDTNSCLPPGRCKANVLLTSVSDQVGERTASRGCSDFHIRHMAVYGIVRILRSAHMSNASMREHCLHCTKPGVAGSSWWSLPIWRQPPDHRSDSTVVVLLWWAAGNMSKEPQTSVSDQVGERTASGGCSDFHIRQMAVYGIVRILRSAHMSNASMREHWSFVVDHVSHPYNKTGTMYVW